MSEKLLPCPFCGEYPLVDKGGDYGTLVWCRTQDGCALYGGGYPLETWNTRHYPPEVTAVLEAAKIWAHNPEMDGKLLRAIEALEETERKNETNE